VLLDAATRILRRHPRTTFTFVGEGPERARLMERAKRRGVASACEFVGHQDDVYVWLATTDVFVLPSRSEAFPNAALEAMAAGLPVVASAVGGLLELIDHNQTGLLVPAGDERQLADAVSGLLDEPARRAALGGAARAAVQCSYSFERMVAGFESVYLDALARRGLIGAPIPGLAAS
jgi:glycosyltransferase involved in cell wall biosynthesis